jgi:hypothetical protein
MAQIIRGNIMSAKIISSLAADDFMDEFSIGGVADRVNEIAHMI